MRVHRRFRSDVMPRAQSYARKLLEQTEQLQQRIPELERMLKEGSHNVSLHPRSSHKRSASDYVLNHPD